jgi:hypothetical protein
MDGLRGGGAALSRIGPGVQVVDNFPAPGGDGSERRRQLNRGEGPDLQGPEHGERGQHRRHLRGRHDHRHLRLVTDGQGRGDREHEDADGQAECPPHDRVITEQIQPGRKAAKGPLHDEEEQREDDADQPEDPESDAHQGLSHPAAGHAGLGTDPGQQHA